MKFRIDCTYHDENILENYPSLKKYNFSIEGKYDFFEAEFDKDGNYVKVNHPRNKYYIDINSIEELIQLSEGIDRDLVILKYDNEDMIEIYDNYRE